MSSNSLIYQIAAALGQISSAAAPSDMPHLAQLGQAGAQNAQSAIQAEAEKKAKEKAEKEAKGDMWGKIGGTLGATALSAIPGVGPIAAAGLGAAGGALGSAAGGAAGGSSDPWANVGMSALTGGFGGYGGAAQTKQAAEEAMMARYAAPQQYPQLQMPTQNPSPNLPRQQMYNQTQAGTGAGTTAAMHGGGMPTQDFRAPTYFDQFKTNLESISNWNQRLSSYANPQEAGYVRFSRDPATGRLRMEM